MNPTLEVRLNCIIEWEQFQSYRDGKTARTSAHFATALGMATVSL